MATPDGKLQVGMAHEVPVTKKLFLRLQYDHTQFREEKLHVKNTTASTDVINDYLYHLSSDLFQLV